MFFAVVYQQVKSFRMDCGQLNRTEMKDEALRIIDHEIK
jgi:hypothetical protein